MEVIIIIMLLDTVVITNHGIYEKPPGGNRYNLNRL